MELTHWKKAKNPDYLGSHDLQIEDDQFKEVVATIAKVVSNEEVFDPSTQKKERKMVIYFTDCKKMILNTTNAKTIAKVCGSDFVERWSGKKIALGVQKIKVGREWLWAVRVKDTPPPTAAAKEALTPEHPKWASALASVQSGAATIEQVEKKYSLTAEHRALLEGANDAQN